MTRSIKIALKITGLTLGIVVFLFSLWYSDTFIISPLDRPWLLSDREETITVAYVNWLCDCANFVEVENFKDNAVSEPAPETYIFIEPSRPALAPASDFYEDRHFSSYLRLTGYFYIDKGIPESYTMKTPEKPDHARVFRYNKIEYVDKQ